MLDPRAGTRVIDFGPRSANTRGTGQRLILFLDMIHEILEADKWAPRKQRHTVVRIFERLRDEEGYAGSYTTVKLVVREWRQQHREVFLPLAHPPGEAQVDLGFAEVALAVETVKAALVAMTLP